MYPTVPLIKNRTTLGFIQINGSRELLIVRTSYFGIVKYKYKILCLFKNFQKFQKCNGHIFKFFEM